MTSHREPERARRRARWSAARVVCAATLLAGVSGWIAACATAETITYGDGDCVGAACQQAGVSSSSSSSGGTGGTTGSTTTSSTTMCTVDMSCAAKWSDIFANIIDNTNTGCTSTSGLCHGTGKGGITLTPGMAHDAYVAMTGYTTLDTPGPVKKYIVPCDTNASAMLCNMKPESGMTNPYGNCGSTMPLVGTSLTMAQLQTIADWIACGAPEN